jgi:hypothetical protein
MFHVLKKPANDPERKANHNAQQDHRSDGKVKAEIFFLHTDITWQPANPGKFVREEVHNDTHDYYRYAKKYDVFASGVHGAKIHKTADVSS